MTQDTLDGLSVFEGFDVEQRHALSEVVTALDLTPDEALFERGDAAESCFVILDGEVVVESAVEGHGRERLARLRRGDLFGEVALLDGGRRSASCTAGPEGARLIQLARVDFDRLFNAGDALAYRLMDTLLARLVRRLRGATSQLVELASDSFDGS